MARRWQHVLQIGDLEIAALPRRLDDQREVGFGMRRDQPAHHRNGGVARILHAEDDLQCRIVLATEGVEIVVEAGILAAERLQYAHRRRSAARGCVRAAKRRVTKPAQSR